VLAGGLAPLAAKIDAAFVFCSMAHGTATQGSDVDILIGNEQVLEVLGRTFIGLRPTAPTCYDVVHEGADP
jgi:predicted nucleotidyltransferase